MPTIVVKRQVQNIDQVINYNLGESYWGVKIITNKGKLFPSSRTYLKMRQLDCDVQKMVRYYVSNV